MSDGDGLFLVVMPSGSKYWRLRYFFAGKEKLLAFGVYPDISLADARERRAEAQRLLAKGNDPADAKRTAKRLSQQRNAHSFEAVAREWYDKGKHKWASSSRINKLSRLERHVFPRIGFRPVAEITAPDVLAMLRMVEARGTLDTAKHVRQMCGQIFMYAIATGRADRNPIPDLRGAIKRRLSNIMRSSRKLNCRNIWKDSTHTMAVCKPSWRSASCYSHSFEQRNSERQNGRKSTGTKRNGEFLRSE